MIHLFDIYLFSSLLSMITSSVDFQMNVLYSSNLKIQIWYPRNYLLIKHYNINLLFVSCDRVENLFPGLKQCGMLHIAICDFFMILMCCSNSSEAAVPIS